MRKSLIFSTGLAMFSMFFGAGNIVFPLALGQFAGDQTFFGIIGLIVTAVLVPLLGLLAMLLYEGDYHAFFYRVGRIPGFLVILLILGLIGPLGALPRCITISYATLVEANGLSVSLSLFSLISCLLIFLFTFRSNKILALLGNVLTPLLLVALVIMIVKGLFSMPSAGVVEHSPWMSFKQGLFNGYNTMDLLAAFFFSSTVLFFLRKEEKGGGTGRILLIASLIAASLLAAIYISFAYLAAGYQKQLQDVPSHCLLGTLAHQLLGPYAGSITGIVVAFACFTTEIALAAVFAEFFQKSVCRERISYSLSLVITLVISFAVSTLHFYGISSFLSPILQICYPSLIALTLLNILHKLYHFQPIKLLFYGALLIAVTLHFVH
jgi:branched-chain amino acid:cation transporter, LIVCS family